MEVSRVLHILMQKSMLYTSSSAIKILPIFFYSIYRIRLAIIQHIPLLARQLGRDFFTEKLSSICVGWLGDDIATIRVAAAQNLKELTSLFGTDWACEYLIPSINDIRHHPSYLRRLTAVQACSRMALEMDPAIASTEVLPIVLEMATDTVSNLLFCCCDTFWVY